MSPRATHLRPKTSDSFTLTDAIRPGPDVPMVPQQGYRLERFRDPVSRLRLPMLAASVTATDLFTVFLALLEPLGEDVQVVLETSHASTGDYHEDLRRGHIDRPVLESHFCDFEDLLLNDGCTGVAVLASDRPIEVQLDEHKLLFVYASDLRPFRRVLRDLGIPRRDDMLLIAESEHIHHSRPEHAELFRQLACRIGAGDLDSVLSDDCDGFDGSYGIG